MARALRFACRSGCTECCRQPGFVYLTAADVGRIAAFLRLSEDDFERRHVYRTRNLARLRVSRDSRCGFLTETGCSIHPVKPAQCRIFPFWPELVTSRAEWRKTARYCPGMDNGALIDIEDARRFAGEMREGYPSLYPPERDGTASRYTKS